MYVMGLHKLTAGDGYTYLTRQVAAHDSTETGVSSLGDYYSEKGESPGRWLGAGLGSLGIAEGAAVTEAQMRQLFGEGRHPNSEVLGQAIIDAGGTPVEADAAGRLGRAFPVHSGAPEFKAAVAQAFTEYNVERGRHWRTAIPADERARIRTEIATARFVEQHGRPPDNDRELAGFVTVESRQLTTAVAGYDLTASPVKTVSVLWALAPPDVAGEVEAAHRAAVEDTLAWLEREVAFTRVGRAGARQVPVQGLVAAAFTHRDSRSGDPDVHTHLAVSNKVQTHDGRWLALDGRVLYKANVAASERYNTRLEAELVERLGVRFVDRTTSCRKRPVREIEGIDPTVVRHWSSRRRAIEVRRAHLARQFQAAHGRPPTEVEAIALAQQATLETRQDKHEPRAESDQRAVWRKDAAHLLGGELQVDRMVRGALGRRSTQSVLARDWATATAERVVEILETSRATWQVWHVRAEAERQVRGESIPRQRLDDAVDMVVRHALDGCSQRLGSPDTVAEPPALQRPDGSSVYEVHGSTTYTSKRVLGAEQRILAAARRTDGRAISDVRVGIALAESAANDTALNEGQAALVRTLATSGRRVQLALAPAGTGKTTAMRVLARAWSDSGGHVVGLAPSAAAAHELARATGASADTLAKLVDCLRHDAVQTWPDWMSRIGPHTLVILDEAGQAGTADLADAVDFLTNRGASLRLVGDDQQLAAVAAGGVLRDLQHSVGAVTLSEVRRFDDPAEAAATLALRNGDPAALGYYADHGRIHVGDLTTATDQAYAAWAADRGEGRDSVLLAPTREHVTRLNARARADRLADSDAGAEVLLQDGTAASAGDVVVTRHNDRRLVTSTTDWVKNGDRWRVVRALHDGSLRVRPLRPGHTVVLPADYVAEHVQLGYATTVHAAQGLTADTCHTVADGGEARQLLYVALTRGRQSNHLYLATAGEGDPHAVIRPEAVRPPTAIDTLADILARDGAQHSATATRRELDSLQTRLHQAALRYHDALGFAAEEVLGSEALDALDVQAEAIRPGLTTQAAYPALRARLSLLAAAGNDPLAALIDTTAGRELSSAADPAAVLDWRLSDDTPDGPLPWLASVPSRLVDDPGWGEYLTARAARVATLAAQIQVEAARWTAETAPPWALPLLPADEPELIGDLAVWRAAFAVPDDDHRPTGPRAGAADTEWHQHSLKRRIREATGGPAARGDWGTILPEQVVTDPAHTRLRDHLDELDHAGLDIPRIVSAALECERPLPVETPADALWWRIAGHLGPAALPATPTTRSDLRPDWTPVLTSALGDKAARRVMADPTWPALVAAVNAAPKEWTHEQLITAATANLVTPTGEPLRIAEMCSAMVWRIAVLTDPPYDEDAVLPPDPLDDPVTDVATPAPPPEVAPTMPVARIVELNRRAHNFYISMYPRSWAREYVRGRLGTDLINDPRYRLGYAPPGPTSLIRHLTNSGATVDELLEAGLARRNDRSQIVDAFRDRLIFAIHHGDDLVGFIGRRNPTKDESKYHGPKYLNTRTTPAFTKGEQLFGLTEGAAELSAGAQPVLVEGPFDAIAVTLATEGKAVGIAPLGTAFTEQQAARLKPHVRHEQSHIVVATDADPAGWASAQRAYWILCAVGANPQHVRLPDGTDPADLASPEGPRALSTLLGQTQPLAKAVLDGMVENQRGEDSPATRLRLVRQAAEVIGALPPDKWLSHIQHVINHAQVPPGALHIEVVERGLEWSADPATASRAAILGSVGMRAPGPRRVGETSASRAPADSASPQPRLGRGPIPH
jgi:DNA primase catalytic core